MSTLLHFTCYPSIWTNESEVWREFSYVENENRNLPRSSVPGHANQRLRSRVKKVSSAVPLFRFAFSNLKIALLHSDSRRARPNSADQASLASFSCSQPRAPSVWKEMLNTTSGSSNGAQLTAESTTPFLRYALSLSIE